MPNRDLLIPEASSAILEPISQQMTYAILARLGLRNTFDNNVYITNDYTKPSLTTDEGHNALISKDRCDVKMTVAWNPSEVKWDVNSFNYTQAYGVQKTLDHSLIPVFVDSVAGVQLTEHQLPCSMALEFSLQFKNRESAFMAISAINNTSLKDSVINLHDLVYDYPISHEMLLCLEQIYQLRKASTPLDFWTYLQRGSRGAVQYLQQRTGNEIELVVKRQDLKAMGVLEYTQNAPSVMEQDRGIDRFVVDFNYTIQFARPDVLRLSFPVVICNQMVPHWMLPRPIESEFTKLSGSLQERSISSFLRMIQPKLPMVVRRPEYDDFRPPLQFATANGFTEFFDAVIILDDTPTTTIDLLNLGGGDALDATLVEIMKLHGSKIFDTTGLINIAVYCNGIPVDVSLLSIDANLVLTIAMSNKLRRYHLVLSEATDLRALDEQWFSTLIEYRTFFPITIIKNLQRLIDRKYCYIDRNNVLLQVINSSMRNFTIDTQIKSLITAGHVDHYAYLHTATPEQFAQYMMHRRSPVSHKLALEEYINLCILAGLLSEAQLATGYIRTCNGYPFLSANMRGMTANFNMPLRIIDSTIVTNHASINPDCH